MAGRIKPKSIWNCPGLDTPAPGRPTESSQDHFEFLATREVLSSTIVGTSSAGHLRANVAVAEKGPLPADLYAEARRRLEPAAA